MLASSDFAERIAAIKLASSKLADQELLSFYRTALDDGDERVFRELCLNIDRLEGDARPLIPDLITKSRELEPARLCLALKLLESLGAARSSELEQILRGVLERQDLKCASQAIEMLAQLGVSASWFQEQLHEYSRYDNWLLNDAITFAREQISSEDPP